MHWYNVRFHFHKKMNKTILKYITPIILLLTVNNTFAEIERLNLKTKYFNANELTNPKKIPDVVYNDSVKWGNKEDFTITPNYRNSYIVKCRIPQIDGKNPTILLTSYANSISVFLEKELIYYSEEDLSLTPHSILLDSTAFNKTMYFVVYRSFPHKLNTFAKVVFGDFYEISNYKYSILNRNLREKIIFSVIFFFLFFMGVVAIVIFFIRIKFKNYPILLYGLFAISAAAIHLHEPDLFYLFRLPIDHFFLFSFFPLFLNVIFFLMFINVTFGTQKKSVIDLLVLLHIINFLVMLVIYLFGLSQIIFLSKEVYFLASIISLIIGTVFIFRSKFYKKMRGRKIFKYSILIYFFLTIFLLATEDIDSVLTRFIIDIPYLGDDLYMLAVFVLSLGLLAVVIGYYRESVDKMYNFQLQLEKNKNEILQLQQTNTQARFNVLKNQVNPHFLFNSLGVLSSLVYPVPNPEKAKHFIDEFSKMFRYILDIKDTTIIKLDKEMDFVNSYLYLQSLRLGNNLATEINIEKKYGGYFVPPLSVQTLVENAIKHNLANNKSPLKITIYIEKEYLVVKNNLQPKIKTRDYSTGLGIENLNERYSLISDSVVNINKTNHEFIVKIPILNDENE